MDYSPKVKVKEYIAHLTCLYLYLIHSKDEEIVTLEDEISLAKNYFNTFNDNSFSNSQETFHPNNCTFNPLDKLVEAYEENKSCMSVCWKLKKEKIA